LRRGRPLGLEAELEMADEFIDGLRVFDESGEPWPEVLFSI
jgi:hypothetical protein